LSALAKESDIVMNRASRKIRDGISAHVELWLTLSSQVEYRNFKEAKEPKTEKLVLVTWVTHAI
jgi:hypothetical protein